MPKVGDDIDNHMVVGEQSDDNWVDGVKCPECSYDGFEDEERTEICVVCGGEGEISVPVKPTGKRKIKRKL